MRLLGKQWVGDFIRKHSNTRSPLRRWQKLVEETDYKNMNELRKTFPHADYVEGKTVFNVGGNKARIITVIEYAIKQVIVTHVLTHEEYDLGKWKE